MPTVWYARKGACSIYEESGGYSTVWNSQPDGSGNWMQSPGERLIAGADDILVSNGYTVLNANTNEPIPDVAIAVSLDSAGEYVIASGTTDSEGKFAFIAQPGATYYIWGSAVAMCLTIPTWRWHR